MYTCIDKTMQIVLERGSIDKYYYTYACKSILNPNIPIFPPNSAEGLHFSAFHLIVIYASHIYMYVISAVSGLGCRRSLGGHFRYATADD